MQSDARTALADEVSRRRMLFRSPILEPGPLVQHERVFRRPGVSLPDHLREVLRHRSEYRKRPSGGWTTDGDRTARARSLRRGLASCVVVGLSPPISRGNSRAARSGLADGLNPGPIGMVGSEAYIVISPNDGWVFRQAYAGGCYDAKYEQMRDNLAAIIAGPEYRADSENSQLIESLRTGVHLRSLSESERIGLSRELLLSLCKAPVRRDGGNPVAEIVWEFSNRTLPVAIRRGFEDHELKAALKDVPERLSHGDVCCDNFVVDRSSYSIIDWDPRLLGWAPGWLDVLTMIHFRSNPLYSAYLRGVFDDLISDALFGERSAANWVARNRVGLASWALLAALRHRRRLTGDIGSYANSFASEWNIDS